MLRLHSVAGFFAAATLLSAASPPSPQRTLQGAAPAPTVTPSDAPAGTDALPVKWIRVAVPDRGAMRAAIARPSGTGPFPAVVILHGTHGFARQYVEWANALARTGFVAVAGCWFAGGGGAGVGDVTPPIPCPEMPPLGSGEYPDTVPFVDALVQATRSMPGVRVDRIALIGHSRGGRAVQEYLLATGNVQAAVLHSSGYALEPWKRAAEFNLPILIMHGTADTMAATTRIGNAREFEKALRANGKPVETAYCEGCGHNTFFTNPAQRDDQLNRMARFLRRHLGR